MTATRKLYLTNGTKYKLEMQDRSITKGVWSDGKFCWMTNLGRTRIPVDLVRRVAVVDSNVSERSADYGWFPTINCFLEKWHPKNRRDWMHPIRRRALGAPAVTIPDDDSVE